MKNAFEMIRELCYVIWSIGSIPLKWVCECLFAQNKPTRIIFKSKHTLHSISITRKFDTVFSIIRIPYNMCPIERLKLSGHPKYFVCSHFVVPSKSGCSQFIWNVVNCAINVQLSDVDGFFFYYDSLSNWFLFRPICVSIPPPFGLIKKQFRFFFQSNCENVNELPFSRKKKPDSENEMMYNRDKNVDCLFFKMWIRTVTNVRCVMFT